MTPATRKGAHGTLHLYAVPYGEAGPEPSGFPPSEWRCWAYDAEHAAERFHEGPDAEGWVMTGAPRRVRRDT